MFCHTHSSPLHCKTFFKQEFSFLFLLPQAPSAAQLLAGEEEPLVGLASASGSRPSAQALAGQQPSSPGAWRGSGDAHCCRPPVLVVAPRLGCQSWYRASIQGLALMTPAARQRQRDLRIQQRGKCIQPSILRIWPFPFKDRRPFVVWCFLLLIQHEDRNMEEKEQKGQR